eukprot:7876806-Heterocapsa_arctica.AAC.1
MYLFAAPEGAGRVQNNIQQYTSPKFDLATSGPPPSPTPPVCLPHLYASAAESAELATALARSQQN